MRRAGSLVVSPLRAAFRPMAQSRSLGLVPMVIEQSGRGERAFDIFSRLLRVRVREGGGESKDLSLFVFWASFRAPGRG